jgi:hypothetical protein
VYEGRADIECEEAGNEITQDDGGADQQSETLPKTAVEDIWVSSRQAFAVGRVDHDC